MSLNCRENCPKILNFEQGKADAFRLLDGIEGTEQKVSVSTAANRKTRRTAEKLAKRGHTADTHELLRSLSDAEFYGNEATDQIREARESVQTAVQAQDDAIELFLEICPAGQPTEVNEAGHLILKCALDD